MKFKSTVLLTSTLTCMSLFGYAHAAEVTVGQKDSAFVDASGNPIDTISINAGDAINFLNQDPYFHNVFSLSDIIFFDLGSFPEGDSREVTFDTPGTAEIECAIHPEMFLTVEVK